MELSLRKLSADDGEDVYEMLQRQPAEENGFENGARGLSRAACRDWLRAQDEMSRGMGLEDWMVPQTIFWFLDGDACVGFGKIRHRLTDRLRQTGGNIGYCIVPGRRGVGYARAFVPLLVRKAWDMGVDELLFTIHRDNPASLAVARACGAAELAGTDAEAHFYLARPAQP